MTWAPDPAAVPRPPKLTAQADAMLENPFWHALGTEHAALAIASYRARRYPADVIPFAALASRDAAAFAELYELLAPGESSYITGELPQTHPGLLHESTLPGLQMIYAPAAEPDREPEAGPESRHAMATSSAPPVELLGPADIPAMLELKRIAFPGYFGPRAPSLGVFYGVRVGGQLVSMAGERLALPGLREVSAVCTHPNHIGHGYSARLIRKVVDDQLRAGTLPFLQVASENSRAIALYRRLGFVAHREILFHRLQRQACA